MSAVGTALEAVFREDWGRLIAGLIASLHDFDLAEDVLQEAFGVAAERWPVEGVPPNPAGWLAVTAHRRAIDRLRRERLARAKHQDLARDGAFAAAEPAPMEEDTVSVTDERLRLIFTCCHPALAMEARVALTLRTLCGLSTREIAHAFLVPEATLAQRLVRAKRKIREAGIPYRVPEDEDLPERLSGVLAVLYLVFNEGYSRSEGDGLLGPDLCAEAIRMARVLAALMPDEPEVLGLLALMLLHHSRAATRIDADGALVLLEDQDRSRWDAALIREGSALVERALRTRRPGPYQVQAAIAAVHANAPTPGATDWSEIAELYGVLAQFAPNPVVELNRAAAIAMAEGPAAGLALLEAPELAGALDGYRLYHAAIADLHRRLGDYEQAAASYRRALARDGNEVERRFLERRLAEVEAAT
ncbi:MAG: RNA polymerase sigma factor [Hyphomicrobiales bacterium]